MSLILGEPRCHRQTLRLHKGDGTQSRGYVSRSRAMARKPDRPGALGGFSMPRKPFTSPRISAWWREAGVGPSGSWINCVSRAVNQGSPNACPTTLHVEIHGTDRAIELARPVRCHHLLTERTGDSTGPRCKPGFWRKTSTIAVTHQHCRLMAQQSKCPAFTTPPQRLETNSHCMPWHLPS